MARPHTALLSPEIIGRAAISLIESGRELQLVPLAKRLGVSVSSLYHHVDGREGVVRAMRQVLIADYELESPPETHWEQRIAAIVRSRWRMYADNPSVLPLLIPVVIDEPNVLRTYEELGDALRVAGVPGDELLTTIEVIEAFTFGVALDRLSPDPIFNPDESHSPLAGLVRNHERGAERNELVLERGLEFILAGIAARVARGAATPPVQP